jgi:hypothetical protein
VRHVFNGLGGPFRNLSNMGRLYGPALERTSANAKVILSRR